MSGNIDWSQIDFIIGVAFGAGVLGLIGFFAVRLKVLRFSGEPASCTLPQAVCSDHSGIIKDVGFLAIECKSIWSEIKDINVRQINLRERLPKEYVSKEDLGEIKGRLKTIDDKLEAYFMRSQPK